MNFDFFFFLEINFSIFQNLLKLISFFLFESFEKEL